MNLYSNIQCFIMFYPLGPTSQRLWWLQEFPGEPSPAVLRALETTQGATQRGGTVECFELCTLMSCEVVDIAV